jgi:hypothetical protein
MVDGFQYPDIQVIQEGKLQTIIKEGNTSNIVFEMLDKDGNVVCRRYIIITYPYMSDFNREKITINISENIA